MGLALGIEQNAEYDNDKFYAYTFLKKVSKKNAESCRFDRFRIPIILVLFCARSRFILSYDSGSCLTQMDRICVTSRPTVPRKVPQRENSDANMPTSHSSESRSDGPMAASTANSPSVSALDNENINV